MDAPELIQLLDQHPRFAPVIARLASLAMSATNGAEFFAGSFLVLRETCGATGIGLFQGEKGRWKNLYPLATSAQPPTVLLTTVLDEESPVLREGWYLVPLGRGRQTFEALAIGGVAREPAVVASLLKAAVLWFRQRESERQRIARYEAILKIAASWRQTLETESLLNDMAEASTKLLNAERASIFLRDRRTKTLVGRPALGVEGNELRIADNVGIVGQVIQSGEPRRVDADIEQEQRQVDRQVDKKLKYQTRTLLCVPLRNKNKDVFGAFEMINKRGGNFTDDDLAALEELAGHAAIALEHSRKYEQLLTSRNQLATQAAAEVEIVGECPAIQALRGTVKRVAESDLAVLVLGENGTGKEVVSRMIHYLSPRKNEPLIAVNCAAIAETLLESELFGHEKGAFTDAHDTRAGKFELAHRGTLFLDEIGDLSLGGQAKLLRVLEEKIVTRVGGTQPIHTDARVIAATNKNLAELVRARKFREDLYFRLNVVTLDLPPLRERGDDIMLLAERFLDAFSLRAQRKPPKLSAGAKKRLLAHPWPGNVRELRNLMERVVYLTTDDRLEAEDLSFILSPRTAINSTTYDKPLSDATVRFQTEYIQHHIQAAHGNMSLAAERLGLHRTNLYRKMRQLGMATEAED